MLDSGASRNYGDKWTKLQSRWKLKKKGITVSCANDTRMKQKEEGELPFDKIPDAAKGVQLLDTMNHPPIGVGKLVENYCTTVFSILNVKVVTGPRRTAIKNNQ